MTYLTLIGTTLFTGILVAVITYIFFRKHHLSTWAFLAGIAPEWPKIFLAPLGATGLETLNFLTHTLGILLFPAVLVIIDITLIELGMTSLLKPFNSYLPKKIKSLVRLEDIVDKLEKRGVIPMPTKIGMVYLIGIFGGVVHLLVELVLAHI